MFDKVEIILPRGNTLVLPLHVETDGFLIEDITGIDPVKVNMVSSSFAQMDGEVFQTARREKRNVLITLQLLSDHTTRSIRDMRNELYAYMMPKSQITVRFTLESGEIYQVAGRVESFESPHFVKDPKAVVSILAFDPDFVSSSVTSVGGSTTSTGTTIPINYIGSVNAGISFEILANRAMAGFTLYNETPSGVLQVLEFVETITSGDFIKIVTIPGSKEAMRTSGAVIKSVLNGVSPYANWISLEPGVNNFRVFAEGVGVPYTVNYQVRLGGL